MPITGRDSMSLNSPSSGQRNAADRARNRGTRIGAHATSPWRRPVGPCCPLQQNGPPACRRGSAGRQGRRRGKRSALARVGRFGYGSRLETMPPLAVASTPSDRPRRTAARTRQADRFCRIFRHRPIEAAFDPSISFRASIRAHGNTASRQRHRHREQKARAVFIADPVGFPRRSWRCRGQKRRARAFSI